MCLEYYFSSCLSQFLCVFPLHNRIESKSSPPNSPHSQSDDHRRFSAYLSLKFPAVLLRAVFIKHLSNFILRGSLRILLSLCSPRRHCTTCPPTALGCKCFRRAACGPWQGLFCQSLSLFPQAAKNLQQNFFLTGQQRIPFFYQSALSPSICVVYMWNWTITKTVLFSQNLIDRGMISPKTKLHT